MLGFVTAEFLFLQHPDLPEGDLTRIRAALVCEQSLYEGGAEAGPGQLSEAGPGRRRPAADGSGPRSWPMPWKPCLRLSIWTAV